MRRALVILFANIGDVLLASPLFAVLKSHYPAMVVDALVNRGTETMLAGNPHIGTLHVLDRKARDGGPLARLREELRLLGAVRRGRYDLTIPLTGGDRGLILGLLSGAGLRVGVGRRRRWLGGMIQPATHWVNHAHGGRHYVERHLDCLRRIGVFPRDPKDKQPRLYESPAEGQAALDLVAGVAPGFDLRRRFAVVHPTSRWMFKSWPAASMARLMAAMHGELGIPMILTSGPDAVEMVHVGQLRARLTVPVVDVAGRLTLGQLAGLIRRAALFVGMDSAPMHMAAAVGTPLVAVFGPSCPGDWGPWGAAAGVVTHGGFACQPCQIDGCGGSKISECLLDLTPERVLERVRRLWIPGDGVW
ncbi:MAG: putative lipopolysaccharide heptosyltransferase III [Magnetococcales bacterium]|nr:putative lipopolysaccharide heptosyltransferase III [Magnetococcales bacterium]